jgi:hypothetical protein
VPLFFTINYSISCLVGFGSHFDWTGVGYSFHEGAMLEPKSFLELKLVVDDDRYIGGQSDHSVHNGSKPW